MPSEPAPTEPWTVGAHKSFVRWVMSFMVGMVIWVGVMTVLGFTEMQDDERDLARRRAEACASQLARDDAYEAIDRDLWIEIVKQAERPPEVAEPILSFIAEQYDELPAPSSCSP